MEFRHHQIMVCDGVMTWPPQWLQTYGPTNCAVSGEVGILEMVFLSKVLIDKVHVLIHTQEDNTYIGTLTFEEASSAKTVFDFLYGHINEPLSIIGAMDFPDDFPSGLN